MALEHIKRMFDYWNRQRIQKAAPMMKIHTISILFISFFILTSFNALAMTESEKLDLCQDMLRDYQSEVTGPNITPQQASVVKEVYEIGFKELGCAQVGVSLALSPEIRTTG
jgi:hypothetical protein